MRIDWWTLGLQTINLLVLLWILSRFLFRPIAAIIDRRQQEIAGKLEDVAKKQAEADKKLDAAQEERKAIAAQRDKLADEARAEAERQRDQVLETARDEAKAKLTSAKEAIAAARDEEMERLRDAASQLAADIAARLLREPAQHLPLAPFLEQLREALEALPDTEKAPIGADEEAVSLGLAREGSPDELKQVETMLKQASGRSVTIRTQVDPELLAGLRLESGRTLIDVSLKAQLARILEKLESDAD